MLVNINEVVSGTGDKTLLINMVPLTTRIRFTIRSFITNKSIQI